MAYGILDTKYIDFPPNIDQSYLRGLQTRGGVSFATVLSEIDARLGTLNASLDPLIANLMTVTTEAFTEDGAPVAFEVTERGEYTLARPQLVEGQGLMIPLRSYDVSIGFTEDGLERMSQERIMRNVDSVLLGLRRLHKVQALTRLFSNAEIRVAKSTTSTSPGFAGSGTGDNVFSRPYPDGTALPGGYTHYYVANTSTTGEFESKIEAMIARLALWHTPPFDLVGSAAAITAVKALTNFVSAGSALIRQGVGISEAMVDAATYAGVYQSAGGYDVRVRVPLLETTSNNLAIFKSYGALAPNNPLVWRYDPLLGRNAVLRYRSLYPLDQAVVKQDFGIGVNDRTAAALLYFGAGATVYTVPTWS